MINYIMTFDIVFWVFWSSLLIAMLYDVHYQQSMLVVMCIYVTLQYYTTAVAVTHNTLQW